MEDYADEAKTLLEGHRRSLERQADSPAPARRSSKKHAKDGVFSYKEVNHVLERAVDEGRPAGLVRALLDLGADVNHARRRSSNLWKKVTGKDQEPERSGILLKAARKSPADVVKALAEHADQDNLDAALHEAIARRDLAVVRVLLAGGADPEGLHADFEDAVAHGDKDLVSVLLTAAKLPCLPCRSAGLAVAVQRDDADVLKLLVGRSADVNYKQGEALLLAIKAERLALVDLLMTGPVPPLPETLDLAAATAWNAMGRRDSKTGQTVIDTCLGSGSAGPTTERLLTDGLVETVLRKQTGVLDVLLKHTVPSDPYHTQAIVRATETGQLDVLEKLLRYKPSETALSSGLSHGMSIKDGSARLATVALIIAAGARGRPVAEALVHATRLLSKASRTPLPVTDCPESMLVDLLLDNGSADVSYNRGEALQIAVRGGLTNVLRRLVEKRPSSDALEAALSPALGLREPSQMHDVVEMLLRGGLREEAVNQCLIDAVSGGAATKHLVRLLLPQASVDYKAGEALVCAIHKQDIGSFKLMLARQPGDETVSSALGEIFCLPPEPRRLYFQELLPNLGDGHLGDALSRLILETNPDLDLLRATLSAGPTIQTASQAFASAVTAGHHEARILQVLQVFAIANKARAILDYASPDGDGPVQLVLGCYPTSVGLVRFLIELRCNFEQTVRRQAFWPDVEDHDNHDFGVEDVSVLLWALLQPAHEISAAVIGEIITNDVNIEFTTKQSRTNPLLVAARQGRTDLVSKLVKAGARCFARDALGRSALFYAARVGDGESVSLLLQKKVATDDGSLHEAARGFHVDVIDQLLAAGHEPNYRSTKHDGRTALGEMARYGTIPSDRALAELAVELLKPQSDPLIQVHGKSVIFLAMDNKDAEAMTQLLLDRILWKMLNNSANIYNDVELHYSPTMYVKKGLFLGPPEQAPALIQLLKGQGAVDRYYATMEMDQPPDAVGMPDEILEFEKEKRAWQLRRQREEEDHQTQLRRKAEQAHQRLQIAEDEHSIELAHTESAAMQRWRIRGLDHSQDVQIAADKHQTDASIRISEAQTKSAADWIHHRDQVHMREDTFQQTARHTQHKALEDENAHCLAVRIKEDRHVQDLRHRNNDEVQRARHDFGRGQLQLELDARKAEQKRLVSIDETRHLRERARIQAEREFQGLQNSAAAVVDERERHQMKMEQMAVERMNMVGEVHLAEWKAWKDRQPGRGGQTEATGQVTMNETKMIESG